MTPRRRALAALVVALGLMPGFAAADAVCVARAPLAGVDDWCEAWGRTAAFDPMALSVAPDGSATVALVRLRNTAADSALAVIDNADGTVAHESILVPAEPGARFYAPRLLAVDHEAQIAYAAGTLSGRIEYEDGFVNYDHAYLVASAIGGAPRWQRMPIGAPRSSEFEFPVALQPSGDWATLYLASGVVVNGALALRTAAIDAATGDVRWSVDFQASQQWAGALGMALSPSGDTLYVGLLRGNGLTDVLAYRTDHTLPPETDRLEWRHREETAAFTYGRGGIGVASDGTIVVSGYNLTQAHTRLAVLALDPGGERRWLSATDPLVTVVRVAHGPEPTDVDAGLREVPTSGSPSLMTIAGDAVVVTGMQAEWDAQYGIVTPTPAIAGLTVSFDVQTGALNWQRTYRLPADRIFFPTSLHSAGGRVLVGGIASDCNFLYTPTYPCATEIGYNAATLAYDAATGERVATARYNHAGAPLESHPSPAIGPTFDFATVSAAGADGTFVTGVATQSRACFEYCPYTPVLLGYRASTA